MQLIASALGLGLLAGVRLYATVLAVGLLVRLDWVALPAALSSLSVLADTRVLAAAGVGCLMEFFADKVPWVDSLWDSIHTVVRPLGAALLGAQMLHDQGPAAQMLFFLLSGGAALTTHATKAATRLVVNHSPEPLSNIGLSLAEDAAVAGGVWLWTQHPYLLLGIGVVFLVVFAWLAPRVIRLLRVESAAFGSALRGWFGVSSPASLPAAYRPLLRERFAGQEMPSVYRVIATGNVAGLKNSIGYLFRSGADLVFLTKRHFRLRAETFQDVQDVSVQRGLLVDQLVFQAGGRRIVFDLLKGQGTAVVELGPRMAPVR